jgi:predicted RNA-binding protein with PUA-like domain
MPYWLFKTEPADYGIADLVAEPAGFAVWDGIRNYQARNLLRDHVAAGDGVFIYHSSCREVGIAGTARVLRAAYPDPTQFDADSPYHDPRATAEAPRWYCVDISAEREFAHVLSRAVLRADPRLSEMVLWRQGRLSVQPVTAAEWRAVLQLAGRDPR